MPDADFCSAVRLPFGSLSRTGDAEQISWGKLSRLPCTIAESTLRTLMEVDFAVRCPLVRCWRLVFGFCPSTRTFAPCFLRTPPRGGSPCIITRPSPPSGWPEDFHLQAAEHAQHTTKPRCGGRLRVILFGRATAISAVSSCVATLLRFVTRFRFNTHISNCPAKKSFLQVAVSKARRAAVSPTPPPHFRRRASDTALRLWGSQGLHFYK